MTLDRWDDPTDPLNGPAHYSGKPCIERGCTEPAGTAWSHLWCQKHNAERMRRVSDGFAEIGRKMAKGEGGDK